MSLRLTKETQMKYKALFLDLDGTILDTLKDISEAVNYSLKVHNLCLKSDDEIVSFLGKGSSYLISNAIGKNANNKVLFDDVFKVYKQYYLSHPSVYTKPYDGVCEVLLKFKQKGGKIALISNKPQDIAIKLLNQFFPNTFDAIYGQMDQIKSKPDPESINLALKDLNVSKKDVLYIGDSLVDYQTALNSQLDVLLCLYGFEEKSKLLKTNANCINTFKEVEEYIL